MLYSKHLPTRYTDVFIAGGGPSGVSAAVTCARQGCSVFLAESRGCFGGLGTAGLVPEIMPFTDGVHFLAGGFGKEIFDALYPGENWERRAHTVQAEKLKQLYDDLMVSSGAQFSFFTTLIDVVTDGNGTVTEVILAGKGQLFAVCARVFIDCTGDGDLCALAGAGYAHGDQDGVCMAGTLCSVWGGVDFSRVTGEDSQALEKAFADGVFTQYDRHLPGMRAIDSVQGIAGGNIGHCFSVDGTDSDSLTKAMLSGRRLLSEYKRYYQNYLAGFEHLQLISSADMMGIRESRRIQGDYTLCLADYLSQAVFDDEIGRYNYPVDMHVKNTEPDEFQRFQGELKELRLPDGASYGIPYRCLIPEKLNNVLVAGRCISTDRAVQASVRVIPGCYITGQATGMAASMATGSVRDIDIRLLQAKLAAIGAFLPNL